MAIVDVVCKLSYGRPISSFLELNFREIENFLRDENHIPCFESEPSWFKGVEQLFKDLYWSILVPSPVNLGKQTATYLERIAVISNYINDQWNASLLVQHNNYGVNFVSLENELVILEFQKTTEEKVKLLLCEKLKVMINKILDSKSIKVVAEY